MPKRPGVWIVQHPDIGRNAQTYLGTGRGAAMRTEVFTVLAVSLAVLGIVRLLTTTDLVRRVIALNIASGGVLMALLVLATRSDPPDAVPHALALTGIVITVSVTGLAL